MTGRRGLVRALSLITALAIAVLVLGLVVTKPWGPALRDSARVGAIEGAIKATEPDSRTVRLPHGFLGLGSLPVEVTMETTIAIGGKLGGFDDLEPGQMVRIAYEIFQDRLVARRIDVMEGLAAAALGSPRVGGTHVNTEQPSAAPRHAPAPAIARPVGLSHDAVALREARRSERLVVRWAAPRLQPSEEGRDAEPVTPSPPPAALVSRPEDVLTVAAPPPTTPQPPRAQPSHDPAHIFNESAQAP